jgi:hypothetical protein
MPTFAMKKAEARNSLQDAANSLLGLINSPFGAGQHPMADRRIDTGPQEGEGSEQMCRSALGLTVDNLGEGGDAAEPDIDRAESLGPR